MAHAEKISGFVKGSPSGKTFMVGSKSGAFTVDTSKGKIFYKGKFFALAKLTGGSQVSVEGTKKGMTIMATKVDIGMLRGAAPAKPTVKKPAVKTPHKPMMKPKLPGKPGSAAKPKDNTKSKTPTKPKADDKTKAKTSN